MNNIAVTVALATAPSSAFEELRARPRFWFPLLLVVLSTAGLVYWYYAVVDIEWLKDVMFSNDERLKQMDEQKRAAAMAAFGRGTLQWSSLVGTLIFLPLVLLVEALYLLVAAKITKLPLGFKHWFTLACWSSLPLLLGNVVAAILLILSDNSQVAPTVLQPLSLNELLFHAAPGSPGYSLFESLTIPSFLCYALMIIGIRVWSHRSWAFSSAMILLPCIVLYGIWAAFAFR